MNKSEEKQFFEKVYYKCNIEPLLEQILGEVSEPQTSDELKTSISLARKNPEKNKYLLRNGKIPSNLVCKKV
jgi:hypothetical protein